MKVKAATPTSVSLQSGPPIEPGRSVEFDEPLPESLKAEIDENVKKGLLTIVTKPAATPAAVHPAAAPLVPKPLAAPSPAAAAPVRMTAFEERADEKREQAAEDRAEDKAAVKTAAGSKAHARK